MLKDITIGQYFEGDSYVHRLDPRSKIIMTLLFIVMLFLDNGFIPIIIGAIYIAIAIALSKIKPSLIFKAIKPVIPILLITAVFNLIFIDSGHTIFKWYFIKITDKSIRESVFMFFRVLILVAGCSMLTYTTTPVALTDGTEKLLSPLKKLKFPVHELAMMMTIALRFIPTLIDETNRIISAQKSRGADFENGKFKEKVKAVIPILVPLFISSFRRAEELATAMECRCYRGGENRTRMKQTKLTKNDFIATTVTLLFIAVIIVYKIIF